MTEMILGVIKFSDEQLPMLSYFNTRKVNGFHLFKKIDDPINPVQVCLTFDTCGTSVSIHPHAFQLLTKDKITLLAMTIGKLAYDNTMKPMTETEMGMLIKPDDVRASEALVKSGALDITTFIPIEKILVIEARLHLSEIVIFMEESPDMVRTISWVFRDSASCMEYAKTYLGRQTTILLIEIPD